MTTRAETNFEVDKARARNQFERAAEHYAQFAVVPNEIGNRLLEHLDPIRITPARIIDAGAAVGATTHALAKRYPKARIMPLDYALNMLCVGKRKTSRWFSRQHAICADAERLPLRQNSVDMVFANLLPSWVNEPDRLLAEFARVLQPHGLLMFSALGPDTLKELRDSFGESHHVHAFMDMHDIGDAMVRAGLTDVVMETERITVYYSSLSALTAELRGLGAANVLTQRARGLLTPGRLKQLESRYENAREADGLPATCEVIYAHAWAAQTATEVTFDAHRL